MLKMILTFFGLALLAFLLFVATRPDTFNISRSTTINAPAQLIEAQIIDFRLWKAWSPWAPLDPNAVLTYSGAELGVGARFHWAGNNEVGEGEMTLSEYRTGEKIVMPIEFIKPFKASNTVEFNFKSEENQTVVTWSMSGKNNFIGKMMGVIFNCDKMVGDMYSQGLSNLKKVVETVPQP